MLSVRKASASDAEVLYDLYLNHLAPGYAALPQDMGLWREKIARFEKDPSYHLLVGETDGEVVSSATCIIIENLTHDARPYALIENVVTRADMRGKRYATTVMERACAVAAETGCYKVMLLTGSKREETYRFYENCGFNRRDKTAFIRRL